MSDTTFHLLIVGGTGRNVGKTTLVCKIIRENSNKGITAIKITPHFHSLTGSLMEIGAGDGYRIFRELSSAGTKDTSRMVMAGAKNVFLIQTNEENYLRSFNEAVNISGTVGPVVCESPSLRHLINPQLFVMVKGDLSIPGSRADSLRLLSLADLVLDSQSSLNYSGTGINYVPESGWSISPSK